MTDAPPPAEPTEPPAASPEPAAAPVPPAYVPTPFPQVLRTPWVNPAKRNQVLLIAIVSLLAVAAIAFVAGLAVGDNGRHGDRGGPVRDFGNACVNAPAMAPKAKCELMVPGRPYKLRPRQMPPIYRGSPVNPAPTPSSASPSK